MAKKTYTITQTNTYNVTIDYDKGLHEQYLGNLKHAVVDHVLGDYNSELVGMEWSEPENA